MPLLQKVLEIGERAGRPVLAAGGIDMVTCSVPEARAMIDAGAAGARARTVRKARTTSCAPPAGPSRCAATRPPA